MGLPAYLQSCLWSYDVSRMDKDRDWWVIINQVLNWGNKQQVEWVKQNYPREKIEEVVRHPRRGMQPEDTFQTVIEGVSVSVFFYPYELVSGLIEFGLTELVGLEDIAAMKVAAVIQRGKQRDFVDIYYLTQKLGMVGI